VQSSQEFALGFSGLACHRAGELKGSARYDPVTGRGLFDGERLHSHRPAHWLAVVTVDVISAMPPSSAHIAIA
jgi:hypothetical protein